MKGRLLKTSIVAAISVVLLYYNIAWAVLRCPHQENHDDLEVVVYDSGAHGAEFSLSYLDQNQASLDCTGPKYHTESLAGSSATPDLLRLAGGVVSHLTPLFDLTHLAPEDVRLDAALNNVVPPIPSIYLPRYLSLSVLRF